MLCFAVHTRIELVAQHRQCRMLAITPMDRIEDEKSSVLCSLHVSLMYYSVTLPATIPFSREQHVVEQMGFEPTSSTLQG